MLQALLEGFTLRHPGQPRGGGAIAEPDLSPYATAVAAVLVVVTRPVGNHASTSERYGPYGPATPAVRSVSGVSELISTPEADAGIHSAAKVWPSVLEDDQARVKSR